MALLTNTRLLVVSALVVVLLAYWWSTNFHAPKNLEQREEVLWIYAMSKLGKIMTSFGENVGLGHKTHLSRKLQNLVGLMFQSGKPSGILTHKENFDGVEVLIIEPFQKDEYGAGLVFFHGGGWVYGTPDLDFEFLAAISESMNMTIVSVDYRLAPEFPFPIPLEDCFTATKYFFENSVKFNVDPFRIALAGSSSGANLAAAVSIKIRDSALPWKNKVQVLLAPCLQAYNFDTPSYYYNQHDDFLPKCNMIEFWLWYALGNDGHFYMDKFMNSSHYHLIDPNKEHSILLDWKALGLPINKSDIPDFKNQLKLPNIKLPVEIVAKIKPIFTNPYFAPLMLKDYSSLPKSFIATAEYDILRDDGLIFARNLKLNGNMVKLVHYNRAFHDLMLWNDHYNLTKKVVKDIVDFLKVNL